MAMQAIKLAKKIGFKNISADLMIGVPNQKKEDLLEAVKILAGENITHISAYMLMLEEGTLLYNKVCDGSLIVAGDDEAIDQYDTLVLELEKYGYNRYEISNFCKKGFECKHNINYWDMGEYLGFGLASHSFVNGIRFENSENFYEYYEKVKKLKNNQNLFQTF